jgi:hypothetical protein
VKSDEFQTLAPSQPAGRVHLKGGPSLRVYVIDCRQVPLADADLQTVDALARLQLSAVRVGARIRLVHVEEQLTDLLGLIGLDRVCGCGALTPSLDIEVGLKAEQRKEAGRVQEERDSADPIARRLDDLDGPRL